MAVIMLADRSRVLTFLRQLAWLTTVESPRSATEPSSVWDRFRKLKFGIEQRIPDSASLTLLRLRSSLWRLARPSKDPLLKVRTPSVEDLMLRLRSLVRPRKALSGISWKLQSIMDSSSSHTRLLKLRGSSWLTDTVSVQVTVRATVWSAGITLKLVLSAWLLMAER